MQQLWNQTSSVAIRISYKLDIRKGRSKFKAGGYMII
jgi:hypothetical protein